MGKIVLGKVAFTPQGEFNPNKEGGYERYDLVYNDLTMYCSMKDNNTSPISDAEAWKPMMDIDLNYSLIERGSGDMSIQQKGTGATATGHRDVALGAKANASGKNCFAFGWNTSTAGYGNFAEGVQTEAANVGGEGINGGCHAEGVQTHATGDNGSHAEGCRTNATGYSSHAEGYSNDASGESSHVGGSGSVASARNAFAHGNEVIANQPASVAFGHFNEAKAAKEDGDYLLFSVGGGRRDATTKEVTRKNLLEIWRNGDIFFCLNNTGMFRLQDSAFLITKLIQVLVGKNVITTSELEYDSSTDDEIINNGGNSLEVKPYSVITDDDITDVTDEDKDEKNPDPEPSKDNPDPYPYPYDDGIGHLPQLPDDGVNDEDVETTE